MSYLVLARKFRPQDFTSISGQEHVSRPLANAIKRGTLSHAFLFCGPRGVGKTSVARVLAKAVNCEQGPTPAPCLKCVNCVEISEGRSLAVREIDGASHNSVDNVRDLIDTLRSQPPPGSKYKVYIIDEVHMLSLAAFNALLKNLEEPPPHTIFILATTDPHKVPDTVISRCQRYDFRAITPAVIEARLKEIVKAEKINAHPEVLSIISRLADGSMRDAQSLLDRVRSLSEGEITAEETGRALGVVSKGVLNSLSEAVFKRDPAAALAIIEQIFAQGLDSRLFLNELASHWRELLIAKFSGEEALRRQGLNSEQIEQLLAQSKMTSPEDLQDMVHILQSGCDSAIRSAYPKLSIEALMVRLATRKPTKDIAEIIKELKKKALSGSKPLGIKRGDSESVTNSHSNLRPVSSAGASSVSSGPSSNRPRSADGLNWREFVKMVASSTRSAMPECLKHLSVEKFEPGVLKALAPKLAQEYFNDSENKGKLVDYLNNYFKSTKWDINIGTITRSDVSATSSILEEDQRARVLSETKRRDDATGHPAMQNIKKFFPGTTFDA